MFIVVNNIIGIIPGMKPGTGTISTTAALALVVFIYFVRDVYKRQGWDGAHAVARDVYETGPASGQQGCRAGSTQRGRLMAAGDAP